jgi:hypothetical protein
LPPRRLALERIDQQVGHGRQGSVAEELQQGDRIHFEGLGQA